MKIRALLGSAAVVVASFGIAAPAQAWECNKMEACRQATMTVCMTIYRVTGEANCQ